MSTTRIRRVRIVLPARLRADAAAIGREIGALIGSEIAEHPAAAPADAVRVEGRGAPAPLVVGAIRAAFKGDGRCR